MKRINTLVLTMLSLLLLSCSGTGSSLSPSPSEPAEQESGSGQAIAAISAPPAVPATPATAPPAAACWSDANPLAHVYHPQRLLLRARCQEAAGRVVVVRRESDGDFHILLDLDPAFKHLLAGVLNPEDSWRGRETLVLEIVPGCTGQPANASTAARCPPSSEGVPLVGHRIDAWGAYVLDQGHGGHAELHPLMSWKEIQ